MKPQAFTVTSSMIPVQLLTSFPNRSSKSSCRSILRHSCSNPQKIALTSQSCESIALRSGFGLKERMLTNLAILVLWLMVSLGLQTTLSRQMLRSLSILELDRFSADLFQDFPKDFLGSRVFCCLVRREVALGRVITVFCSCSCVRFRQVLAMVSEGLRMQAQLLRAGVSLNSRLFCLECSDFIPYYQTIQSITPFATSSPPNSLICLMICQQFKSMGQSNANPFREGGEIMSEYSIEGKVPEQSLTFLTHKSTKKEYLLREQTFNDLREFAQSSDRLKKRSCIRDPHLTNLVRIEERTEDHLCSNFYKIYSLWEFPNKSLADEVTARALQKKPFESTELWSILACSIMGLAALEQQEVKHECLTAKAILVCEDGNMRVVDPLAMALPTNIDCVYNNRSTKHIYLSPEQCESVQTQKPIINKNPYKNDVFVLGMILLECGLLERQDQCYLNDCSAVSFERIEANLRRFGSIYEDELRQMVEQMLLRDIRERPDWTELLKYVDKKARNGKASVRGSQLPKRDHFITRVNAAEPDPKRPQSNQQSMKAMAEPPKSMFYKQPQTYVAPATYVSPANTYPQQEKLRTAPNPFSSSSQNMPVTQVQSAYYKPPEIPYRVDQFNPLQSNTNPFTVTFSSQAPVFTPPSTLQPPLQQQQPIFSDKFVPNNNFTSTFSKEGWSSIPFVPDKQSISSNLTTLDQRPFQQDPSSAQYVRPAQSVSYEVTKPPQAENRMALPSAHAIPLNNGYRPDPKLTRTPQIGGDLSELQLQPTFVEQHFKMGSRYEGYKLNGQRHGRGKFFYQDGGSYDGEWRQNKMEGRGTLYYQSDRVAYEGAWVADKFQGFGKLYNEFPQPLDSGFDFTDFDGIDEYWAYYEGNFSEDLKDGHGLLKFSNGETFEGSFREDMVEGEGVFRCRDGRSMHGIWHQNHLQQQLQ